MFIDAWGNKDFRDFRHLYEMERFLDMKRNLNKKRKVNDLRFLLDKFYSLYSSWSKFFPCSTEKPGVLKKRVLVRSKFFSQLLRSFEGLVGDLVTSLKDDSLEHKDFVLNGSFNFVNISLEHQLKLNHKMRRMDVHNQYARDSQKRDCLDYVFKDSVNVDNATVEDGQNTQTDKIKDHFSRLMLTDGRFISKNLPHPALEFISDEQFLQNLSLNSIRLLYREALFWRHKHLAKLEKVILEKQASGFPEFKFFVLELRLKDFVRRDQVQEAFELVVGQGKEDALPNHLIFELYFRYIMRAPAKPPIEYLKELFDFFVKAYAYNQKYICRAD